MPLTKTITAQDGKKYTVSAMTVKQLRAKATTDKEAQADPYTPNIQTIAYCLTNAGKEEWTPEMVEDLPYPVFRELMDAAFEVSGFSATAKAASGESSAT